MDDCHYRQPTCPESKTIRKRIDKTVLRRASVHLRSRNGGGTGKPRCDYGRRQVNRTGRGAIEAAPGATRADTAAGGSAQQTARWREAKPRFFHFAGMVEQRRKWLLHTKHF